MNLTREFVWWWVSRGYPCSVLSDTELAVEFRVYLTNTVCFVLRNEGNRWTCDNEPVGTFDEVLATWKARTTAQALDTSC